MQSPHSDFDSFVPTSIQALETLAFLQLLVPQVSSPPPTSTSTFSFSDLLLLRFGSAVDISLRIDKLPVETALSKFFADVLPQNIDIGAEDFEDDVLYASHENFDSRGRETELSEETKVLDEEKEVERQRPSRSKAMTIEVSKKSNGKAVDDKITQLYEVTQFETPELDVLMENASFFENEGIQILSKAPEIEEYSDLLKPGLLTHYPCGVQSIISVEKITFEYPMERKDNLPNDCSFQDQIRFNQITFPVVEVDEIVLEQPAGFSVEEKLLSFFENIELQHSQKDNLNIGDKELLGSNEYDISGLLSDHYPSFHSIESELGSIDNFPEVDLIRLVEMSHTEINSGLQGTSDCDRFLSDKPVLYEEFRILDVDPLQIFEALLNGQTACELETCDWMFSKDTNFKDFNKLVVSHELTLVDDAFKSLPVPVICDHEKLSSFYAIIEAKLANLRPHPLSALDGIYLDWHLLEDKYRGNTYFSENILKDVGSLRIDDNWDSFGDRNVVDDFVFSDDSLSGFSMDENEESKEFLSDVSVAASVSAAVESSSKFPQPDNGERVAKKNSERALLMFKSMSQSNDLDFFLNAQKATIRSNSEPASRAVHSAASPKNPAANSVAAISQGRESITISDMDVNVQKQGKLLYDLSMEEEYYRRAKEATGKVESDNVPLPIPSIPFVKESNDSTACFPETVIVVNTQTVDKEMIVSRRSTYQRILAMEKEGAQVVERDSDLPVDVIVNSAICLVWYDCRNIGKKATNSDEASSCLPLCIENIATNVLTLLSFNFSGCMMVFEGENDFLYTIMESSDGFYAAAASLGIDVQLFCSYSSELTDEIIMSCIGYATRGVYPTMPESETLAESFLTKFPSVNPLTAHAILSSGGTLVEFLEWSNEQRIRAIQKYLVRDESITLLGALCKYGERDDSKSIMTDCSSSVSSGTDSKNFNQNVASKRKRWKSDGTFHHSDRQMDDLLHIDPVNQFSKDSLDPSSSEEKPYDSFMLKYPETFHEFRKPRLYTNNLFQQEPDLDVSVMINPSVVPKPHDFQVSKEPQMFRKIRNPELSLNDKLSGQLQGTDAGMFKNFDFHNVNSSDFLFEDEKGEVIDLAGSPGPGKQFFSIADPISFLVPEIEKDASRKSKTARRLSFGRNHQTTFPASAEVLSSKNIWNPVEDQRYSLQVGINSYSDTVIGDDVSLVKHPDKLVEDCFKQNPAEKSHGLQVQEDLSFFQFGGTPLKNALNFSSPGKNSPWSKDFLAKIREKGKSRLQNQSLPCEPPDLCVGGLRSVSKVTKRRSPSILDFFKYQGNSTSRRILEQKKQKRSMQSSSLSKDVKTSASAAILPTWTPLDKRSRQALSFALNNGESQTKLVWNEGTSNPRKKFQKQI